MSNAEEQLLSGQAWHEFCNRLKAVGDSILGDDYPDDPLVVAEGYRALTRQLSHALRMEVESSDPLHPVMMRDEEPHCQWGGPNPDNTYMRAVIDPAYEYRVWGNLKAVRELIFALHEGDMQLKQYGVFSEKTIKDLEIGPDGEFELWISSKEHSGNWMPMHELARMFQVRIYLSDWAVDASPTLHIERVGAEGAIPPVIDPGNLAEQLGRAVNWVEKSAVFWNRMTEGSWSKSKPNHLTPARSIKGGADNLLYGTHNWHLADDEASVMVFEKPEASYWSFCIHTMNWLESGDMANRQVSLSGHQVHVDDDGMVRIVLSAQDPGVPNWIDTQGHPRGVFSYRSIDAKSNPEPQGEVVKIDKVRDLMPEGHPAIDDAERRRRLAIRREQYWNRYT